MSSTSKNSQLMLLGELAAYHNGRAFKPEEWVDSGLPIVRIQNLTSSEAEFNYYDGEVQDNNLIENGDLLISWSASLDAFIWGRGRAVLNQHIFKVVENPKLVTRQYLYYVVCAAMGDIRRRVHGTTMQHITRPEFEKIRILVPPLPEQHRIAALLGKADRLRRLRRYSLQLSDTYLQSLFLQMFGDVRANPHNWEVHRLADLISTGDKINYGVVQPGNDFPGGTPIIRVGDLENLVGSTEQLKRIDPAIEATYKKSRLRGDELLIACVGSIGKIALAQSRLKGFNIVRAVARVPIGNSIDRLFLASYLSTSYIQDYFTKETRTVSQPTLNIQQIEETPVWLPPLPLQQQFAHIVQKHERLRTQQREAERQADHLFQTLLHRAFSGELPQASFLPFDAPMPAGDSLRDAVEQTKALQLNGLQQAMLPLES